MQRDIAVATTIVLIGRDLKAKLVHDLHTITEGEKGTRPHPSSATVPKREAGQEKKRTENIDVCTDIDAGYISYFFSGGNTHALVGGIYDMHMRLLGDAQGTEKTHSARGENGCRLQRDRL
jgi:hypothetical protein